MIQVNHKSHTVFSSTFVYDRYRHSESNRPFSSDFKKEPILPPPNHQLAVILSGSSLSRTCIGKEANNNPSTRISNKAGKERHSEWSEESGRLGRNRLNEILRCAQDDSQWSKSSSFQKVYGLLAAHSQLSVMLNQPRQLPVMLNGSLSRTCIGKESNNHYSIRISTKAGKERHSERSEETKTTKQKITSKILRSTQDDRRFSNRDDNRPSRKNRIKQVNSIPARQSQLPVMLNGSSLSQTYFGEASLTPCSKAGKERHSEWSEETKTTKQKITSKILRFTQDDRRFSNRDDYRPSRITRIKQVNSILARQSQLPVILSGSEESECRTNTGELLDIPHFAWYDSSSLTAKAVPYSCPSVYKTSFSACA